VPRKGVAVAILGDRPVELAGEIGGQDDLIPLVLGIANLDERSIPMGIPGQGAELEPGLRARHGPLLSHAGLITGYRLVILSCPGARSRTLCKRRKSLGHVSGGHAACGCLSVARALRRR
jgi:hypothetical protein